MKVKDIEKIISSATTAALYVADSRADAVSEKGQRVGYFYRDAELGEYWADLEVAYIYPVRKDDLNVWAIRK